MTSAEVIQANIGKLLDPIPQYVLGCLPAIAIMGACPKEKFSQKLTWVLRCLGCPFTGLLYACNVGTNEAKLCIYWLTSEHFSSRGQQLNHRPVGIYTMSVDENQDEYRNIMVYVRRCTARVSVLERLSSLVSAYYIIVGVIAAISRATDSKACGEDWPYLSLLLSWTIPAVFKRVISGTQVVKDPNDEFRSQNVQIVMIQEDESRKKQKKFTVLLVAIISMIYPWITILVAFFTSPHGYHCRSQVLTGFCVIWSINSFLAYVSHLKRENNVEGHSFLHIWFSTWGFLVAIGLFILSLFANNVEWWGVFKETCRVTKNSC